MIGYEPRPNLGTKPVCAAALAPRSGYSDMQRQAQ
ncbi:hypothetical protein FHS31_002754 [Sphingomonas vulcanisoli]|uniref:Uncharacterized protein n=1 Tax=Sphingomonas vulcanisoli TaxID=1658060 RepID=A0ABX0TUD3_9SPHN|nr:hypothetical protein [Sphingomonas vulcanisoli]